MTEKTRKKKNKETTLLPPEEALPVAPPPTLTFWQRFKKGMGVQVGKLPNPVAMPPIDADLVNEKIELTRINTLIKRLTVQSIVVAVLAVLLALAAPFVAPIYIYKTITPEGHTTQITALNLPNLTNPAIVNWAATSVTEVLSYGFGDIEAKTLAQKQRFTKHGWDAFVKAFFATGIDESFKKNQMVMTSVPTNTPIIISQGVNKEGLYEWKLEVPIVTTYAANNNIIHPEYNTIVMTIIRVSGDENPAGIAIDIWRQIKN